MIDYHANEYKGIFRAGIRAERCPHPEQTDWIIDQGQQRFQSSVCVCVRLLSSCVR